MSPQSCALGILLCFLSSFFSPLFFWFLVFLPLQMFLSALIFVLDCRPGKP